MLEAGAEAPDFTLKDQNGQPVTLGSLRRRNVLLVFFPLAFTGICQGELDEIRDNPSCYDNADTQTLAISVGPPRRTRSGRRSTVSRSRCYRTSGRTERSPRRMACSTRPLVSPTAARSWSIGPE
jgi:hypothetical protein